MYLSYPRLQRLHSGCPSAAPADTRPSGGPAPRSPRLTTPLPVQSGALVIDRLQRTAVIGGRQLDLTYVEFELLAHLASRPRQVHTRHQLISAVWGRPPVGDARTIDVHIARLRRKFGPEHRATLTTVRNVGYTYDPSRAAP
ncbi:winged helix-turn-helix domain-containing protein [Streptomyces olivoreticuli]